MTQSEFRRLNPDHKWWETCHRSDAPRQWLRTQVRLLTPAQRRFIRLGLVHNINGRTLVTLRERGMLDAWRGLTELGRHVRRHLKAVA